MKSTLKGKEQNGTPSASRRRAGKTPGHNLSRFFGKITPSFDNHEYSFGKIWRFGGEKHFFLKRELNIIVTTNHSII
jgi:hypothetical protein